MSDMEDAEFLECPEDTTVITEEKDTSVEVIGYEVKNGDREDIVQTIKALKNVKSAIKYQDEQSLQDALDKIKERPYIDAEFQEQITMLKSISESEEYADFREVVNDAITQLNDAQETSKGKKTSLSRSIEILKEVLPIFTEACSSYVEKVEPSPQINLILRELDGLRIKLKECEKVEVGDVEAAKKYEKKGEVLLEDAVKHGLEDVKRIEKKIKQEKDADMLKYFQETRKETNSRMDFLTNDFDNMKNNCAEDIQLTENALCVEAECTLIARRKFEEKDKELDELILADKKEEERLREKLQKLIKKREELEEDREVRKAVQQKAEEVHAGAEKELNELLSKLNELLPKVNTASVVLKQTKDVCNMLFDKAVESKNIQNRNLDLVLLQTMENRHIALIAQGVNFLSIQEREKETVEMIKEKLKKKKGKLNEAVKHHWASEAKKLREKIDRLSKDMELSKKNEQKVAEKLDVLTEKISEVEMKLDESCVKYVTLKQRYEEYKQSNDEDGGFSLTSMSSF
ncbi:cingulin-like isoform X1 [Xenia sp. Carnegie-2017]|uniref:cingulin-like isoform X1 n=1 Tax=Xenia sp. Carnegie-2017 TaxID=2897299 RepID=UPI001F038917|nr:cingulin-like isoform X1 [Xenia sp. Carnegie-2017]